MTQKTFCNISQLGGGNLSGATEQIWPDDLLNTTNYLAAVLSEQSWLWTFCRSVRVSLGPVHCGKTTDQIRMPFGNIGRAGPGMRHVVGFGDRSTGRGTFGDTFGARHCTQWRLYNVRVRQCLNCRSCGLGWCVRWAKALLYYMGSTSCKWKGRFGGFVPHFHNGKCHWVADGEMFPIRMRKLYYVCVPQTCCWKARFVGFLAVCSVSTSTSGFVRN